MPTEILNDTTLNVLRSFADKLWLSLINTDADIKNIQSIYDKSVDDLLPTKKKTNKKKKASIPIPFYGLVEQDCCFGVKKNHGLYTQCIKPKPDKCDYCTVCMRQATNNADGKPNCGNINERAKSWNENLDYKPPGMKQEIPYANIMKKLNINISDAQEEVEKRYKAFDADIKHWDDYDYVLINENLDNCYKQIEHIIKINKNKFTKPFHTTL